MVFYCTTWWGALSAKVKGSGLSFAVLARRDVLARCVVLAPSLFSVIEL